MKGKVNIALSFGNEEFYIELTRKVTFLKGDSGIGKTVFFNALKNYYLRSVDGISEDIKLSLSGCDRLILPSVVGKSWRDEIENNDNCVVVVDESDRQVLKSGDFGSVIKKSGNYFLIIYRKNIWLEEDDPDYEDDDGSISHSTMAEITLECKKSNGVFKNISSNIYYNTIKNLKPDLVITEDEESGYQFFKKTLNCDVISSKSKSRVLGKLKGAVSSGVYKNIYLAVDGENFGYELGEIFQYIDSNEFKKSGAVVNIADMRSFEYTLLKSADIFEEDITDILENTEKYCEAKIYNNWEKFYTSLIEKKRLTFLEQGKIRFHRMSMLDGMDYDKGFLSDNYLKEGVILRFYSELLGDIDMELVKTRR